MSEPPADRTQWGTEHRCLGAMEKAGGDVVWAWASEMSLSEWNLTASIPSAKVAEYRRAYKTTTEFRDLVLRDAHRSTKDGMILVNATLAAVNENRRILVWTLAEAIADDIRESKNALLPCNPPIKLIKEAAEILLTGCDTCFRQWLDCTCPEDQRQWADVT